MTTPTALALYLAANIHHIAADENAGQIYNDIHQLVDTIERMINRPRPPRYCGPCPTPDPNANECKTDLFAERHTDIEVTCWKCKTIHNIEKLIQTRLAQAPHQLYDWREVLQAMAYLEEPIPLSTWRRWRAEGKVQPHGELYGEPAYRLEDVREMRRKYSRPIAS